MVSFSEYQVKSLKLKNRIVMPPMCMYSSDESGLVMDFHKVHYGSRSIGGAGLVIQEATAVAPNGRISTNDLGIWEDAQLPGLAELVRLVHAGGAAMGIQLAHAGRKCESEADQPIAPSALAFSDEYRLPAAMTAADIDWVIDAFAEAARRAGQAGYDLIEIHAAHGYLIHEFLSPLANRRNDEYGGPTANRVRFLREILAAVRSVWPAEKPLGVRLSASDYLEGGIDIAETIRIVDAVKDLADIFHISSGGLLTATMPIFPGYQVKFAESVRQSCHVPTIAVGLISQLDQVEEILASQRADLVALGRELLRNPYWPLRQNLVNRRVSVAVPEPYERAFK